MSCPCNASALRLFARGLVQVHHPEPGSRLALPIRGYPNSRILTALGSAATASPAAQRQLLHTSRALRNAADVEAAKPVAEQQTMSTDQQAKKHSTAQQLATESRNQSADSNRFNSEPVRSNNTIQRGSEKGAGLENEAEIIAKRAWKFKTKGFDWKAFRSKDPAKRQRLDLSNFDWDNWKGKKFARNSTGINTLLTNLEKAQERDREAIGIMPRPRFKHRKNQGYDGDIDGVPTVPNARNELDANVDGLPAKKREEWMVQKEALKTKFPEGWRPRKRLSPDALAGIRALNAQFPDVYTTQTLSEKFEVSAEAIRRILRSRWQPSVEEEEERSERWHRRGKKVWEHKAAHGIKPPKRWRDEGIALEPEYYERRARASRATDKILQKSREQYMKDFERHRAPEKRESVVTGKGSTGEESMHKESNATDSKLVTDAVDKEGQHSELSGQEEESRKAGEHDAGR